jgi:outer membrane protein assembly factor BamB
MTRRLILAALLLGLTSLNAQAQIPFPRTLVPSRTGLGRLGLEKHWYAVVPLARSSERVLRVSMAENLLFAQTNLGIFHALDSESGQLLWTVKLGTAAAQGFPACVNSDSVFVTNYQDLFALDRVTGRIRWTVRLEAMPSTATAADEERVMVGLATGKLVGFTAKDRRKADPPGRDAGKFSWAWQSDGSLKGRPIPAGRVVAFGSSDGKVYVALDNPVKLLFRFLTGGPITGSLGTYGTRTVLVPSEDNNVYAVDLFNGGSLWTYATGGPVSQEPLVANDDVYALNQRGTLYELDAKTGEPRWIMNTVGGNLLAVGANRVYLRSANRDLFLVDRKSGQVLFDPRATLERAGVNLRDYDMALTNAVNDRLYFATSSGFIMAIRELGKTRPTLLRDPKQPKFGFLPPDGEAQTPVPPPAGAATDSPPAAGENAQDKPEGAEPK